MKRCKKCNKEFPNDVLFCSYCGQSLEDAEQTPDDIVSVGTYLWLTIVFSIPVAGLIISIVMAFAQKKSQNLCNLARAYIIIQSVLTGILAVLLVLGILAATQLVGPLSDLINNYIDRLGMGG